jgi:hypothetical protein
MWSWSTKFSPPLQKFAPCNDTNMPQLFWGVADWSWSWRSSNLSLQFQSPLSSPPPATCSGIIPYGNPGKVHRLRIAPTNQQRVSGRKCLWVVVQLRLTTAKYCTHKFAQEFQCHLKCLGSFFGSPIDQCISLKEERQPKEAKKKKRTKKRHHFLCTDWLSHL